MAGKSRQETEVKIALPSAEAGERLLRGAGFRVVCRRVFEANTVYDTPDRALRASGRLLRVRTAGKTATVTYKGVATIGRHKSREELETTVADAAAIGVIFERLGYQPMFRYEKYRTEYRRPGARGGIAMIDRTPAGDFMELEGTPAWIDRTARQLGFSHDRYDTRSYGRVYLDWCAANGVEPAHMVFTPRPPRARTPASRKAARKSPPARG
jgi:adenylate cyclase, class 2